jgi:hypothetical protein
VNGRDSKEMAYRLCDGFSVNTGWYNLPPGRNAKISGGKLLKAPCSLI